MIDWTRHILFASLVLLIACDPQNKPSDTQEVNADSSVVKKRENSDSVHVMTLPTPMQIPALLKNTRVPYDPDKMLSIRNIEKTYFKSSIVFGAYLMDMAYASSYSHQQASIAYFEACRKIGNDMGLGATMTEGLYRRFKRNQNSPDSLGRMILKVYDSGHKLLIHQEKEGLGLLMVLGCYMEGLYFNLNQVRQNDLILFVHLLNQNKNYGNNLIWMLNQYEIPDEVRTEFETLELIVEQLNQMDIPTIYDLKTGKKSISSIKTDQLDLITNETIMFRENILR